LPPFEPLLQIVERTTIQNRLEILNHGWTPAFRALKDRRALAVPARAAINSGLRRAWIRLGVGLGCGASRAVAGRW
jgi:hypothetical protein